MELIFKNTLFTVNLSLNIAMLFSVLYALHISRGGQRAEEHFQNHTKCFICGIILKLVYWIIIPEPTDILSKMFTYDILLSLICIASALVYLLPLHLIYKRYRKNQTVNPVRWIRKASITIIMLYIVSYLISVPLTI